MDSCWRQSIIGFENGLVKDTLKDALGLRSIYVALGPET